MRERTYNMCMLDVFNAFCDEIIGKIRQALRERNNGCLILELTAYADYCVKLLQNNGYDVEQDADDILLFMWRACPAQVLAIEGYPNCSGQWDMRNGTFYLKVYL